MGARNSNGKTVERLANKTLDAHFLRLIQDGMNCSPFESHAILEVVKEVYFPFLDEAAPLAPPGKITLIAVSADEPAGKPIPVCEKTLVCLTVHRGPEDDQLLQKKGPTDFRRARIADLCQQALSQGGLLTREDLAGHVFFVSPRTISRDLAFLRKNCPEIPIPLRSTVHDIGPVLTHRVKIVRLALEGKTTTEIRDITHHSPEAISNYISTFIRCAQLVHKKMQKGQIAFLLRRSSSLIESYLELLAQCEGDKNMSYHLEQMLQLGNGQGEKKTSRRNANGR